MKNKKYIVLLVIFCMFMAGCGLGHIEDTNGKDDFTIQTFTEEDILSKSSTTYTMSSYSRGQNNNTIKGMKKAKKFTGVDEVEQLRASTFLKIEIETKITQGNFKVVIIKDNKIIDILPLNTNIQKTYDGSGKYVIKIVGESAQFEINYKILYE